MNPIPLRATASSGSQSARSVKDADLELDEHFKQELRRAIELRLSDVVRSAKEEYDRRSKAATNEEGRKFAEDEYNGSMMSLRMIATDQFKELLMIERQRRLGTATMNPGLANQYVILDEIYQERLRRQETGETTNGREPSNLRRPHDDMGAVDQSWFPSYTSHGAAAAYPSPVESSLPAPIPIGRTDNIDSFTEEEVAHSFGNHIAGVGRKPSSGSLSSIRSRHDPWSRVNGSPGDGTSRASGFAASPSTSNPPRRESSSSNVLSSGIAASVPRSSSPPAVFGLNRRDSNASVASSRSGRRRGDSDSRNYPGVYGSIATPPPPSPYANAASPAYPYASSSTQPGTSSTKKDTKSPSFFSGLSATAPRQKSPMPTILSPPPPPSLSLRQNIDHVNGETIQPQRTGDERAKWLYSKGKDVARDSPYKPWLQRQHSLNDLQPRKSESPAPVISPTSTSTDYPLTPESYRQPSSSFMNSAMRRAEPEQTVGIPIKPRGLGLTDLDSSPSPDWHKNSPVASLGRAMGRRTSFEPEHRPRNPSTSPVQSRMPWAFHRPVRRRTSASSYRSGRSSRSQSTRPEIPVRAATVEDWSQMETYEEQSHDGASDGSDIEDPEWEDIFDEREIARREAEAAQKEKAALMKLEELKKKEEEIQHKEEEARRKEDLARQKEEDVRQKEELARWREEEVRRKEEVARRKEMEARKREEEALRKAEEARKMEEEARKMEDDARKLEEDARRKEEDARKKEEDARRMELDARRIEAEARRKEAQAEQLEEDLKRRNDEADKTRAGLKKKEQDAKRKEEEARRREEDARRKEEDARRKEEDARKKEEDARRREEDAREKAEEARQRMEDAKRRADDAKQRVEEARAREEVLKRKEEEVKQRERELCRREEELDRREAETRRQEEERRTEEYLTDMARQEQRNIEDLLAEQSRIAAELLVEQEARRKAEELAERLQIEEERRAHDLAVQEERHRTELRQKEEERRRAEELAEERRVAEALAEEERRQAIEAELRRVEAIAAQEDARRREREREERLRQRRLQEEKEEEERRKQEEESQRRAAEFRRRQEEEFERLAAEARRKQEEEIQRQAADARRKQEEEAQRQAEDARRKQEEIQRQATEAQRKQEEEAQRQQGAELRRRQEEARRLQEFRQQQQQQAKEEETRRLQEFARHQEELRKQVEEQIRKRQESAANGGSESLRTNTPYAPNSYPYPGSNRYSSTSTGSNGSTSSTWSNGTSASSWSNKSSATSGSQSSAGTGSARTATGPGWRSASTAPYATPEGASAPRQPANEDREKAWRERQEEQARKQAEAFMREQERIERERASRAGKAMSKEDVARLFDEHERQWARIPTMDILGWGSFAWPVLRKPSTPEELTTTAISAYVLNPNNPSEKSDKDRIKEHIRRWHPDRFETKLLAKVRADEREKVKEGAGQVVRSLNELLRQT